MANQAAKYGIPIAEYKAMGKSEREDAKAWCRANPDRPFSEYVPRTMATRVAETAAVRGVSLDVYEQMTPRERNALRMWLRNNPDRTGTDYLAGVRARMGPSSRVDRKQVFALRAVGLAHNEIAKAVGCGQSHISRILNGKRCAA